ncbi:MAG: hypothetical protein J6J51_00575, partial [Clostridia bacterium]|nr:hypothetical protein [Clostridia bacterium]
MKLAADFQRTFERSLTLPARLAASFEIHRCLSVHEDRALWVLHRRADGAPFLLRTGQDLARVREEFRLLTRAAQVIPGAVPWPVDYFEEDGAAWFLRSWMTGQPLDQWREARGGCSDRECIEIGRQLCGLLQTLHSLEPPVIHRDIKPENLIMGADGKLGIVDFDTARVYRDGLARDTKCLGTEATAAPEQYGFAQTDPRTDLYGLGMTLLWLRTGSYDRAGFKTLQPRLRKALERATDFSPDRRFNSCTEFARALRPKRVGRWLLSGVAGLLCAAALTAVWQQQSRVMEQAVADAQTQTAALQAQVDQLLEEREREAAAQQALAQPVTFTSQCLEMAVRASLNKSDGEITYGDLQQVTRIALVGWKTFSADSAFTYIHNGVLNGEMLDPAAVGDVEELSLLTSMPNLRELILCDQPVTDLSPLEGLPLQTLYLCHIPAEDYSVLSSLTQLRELNLSDGSEMRPVQTLRGCLPEGLTKLTLVKAFLSDWDWSFLAELDQVHTLVWWFPTSEGLPYLADMEALWELTIGRYPEENLQALNLPGLDSLSLQNGPADLQGVEQMEELR